MSFVVSLSVFSPLHTWSGKLYVILSTNACTCMHYKCRGWSNLLGHSVIPLSPLPPSLSLSLSHLPRASEACCLIRWNFFMTQVFLEKFRSELLTPSQIAVSVSRQPTSSCVELYLYRAQAWQREWGSAGFHQLQTLETHHSIKIPQIT